MGRTLIIGNGFDLDLGLNTSYRDFAKSDLWPIGYQEQKESFLAQKLQADSYENWFDLENSLCEYAQEKKRSKKTADPVNLVGTKGDLEIFHLVEDALFKFISNHQKIQPNKDSIAARVLKAIVANGKFNKVLSFNYTDLNDIAFKLGLGKIEYSHVHGSCLGGHIVLGVSDDYSLRKGYEEFYKTNNTHYHSPNVRYALQGIEEVVFFGHSLGSQDFHYFSDFFYGQSIGGMKEDDSIRITFFTKDETSQQSLKAQLRGMMNQRMNNFMDNNIVNFIRTQEGDSKELNEFLAHLSKTSLAADRHRMASLASML